MRNSDGFTLIELMIVVAIIALLAAISIPIYQTYVARSQLAVALDELRPGRTTIESHIAEGKNASLIDAGYVGLRTSQRCTHVTAQMQADTRAELSCELAGTPSVAGKTMRLVRNTEGIWTCNTSEFDARLRPVGCS